jgi:hypothetical protein
MDLGLQLAMIQEDLEQSGLGHFGLHPMGRKCACLRGRKDGGRRQLC